MGYKKEIFETAIRNRGFFLEHAKTNELNICHSAYGSIRRGNLLKQVRWNDLGHCFDRKNFRLERYDLLLQETKDNFNICENEARVYNNPN